MATTHTNENSVVIVGGGLVGLLAALLLAQDKIAVQVLEKSDEKKLHKRLLEVDRPISLNYRSYLLLKKLGVWEGLKKVASPICHVHVSEKGAYGVLRFSAKQNHIPVLGYVVPYRDLHEELLRQCKEVCDIEFQSEVESVTQSDQSVNLRCCNGLEFESRLLVAADGVHSKVRELLDIATTCIDRGKVAVTGVIDSSCQGDGTAYQRFTTEGIFAILPGFSQKKFLVWTMSDQQWQDVSQYDENKLAEVVESCMGSRLGSIASVQLRVPMPLQRVNAATQVSQRVVLLGNAAHTIYPIAAQGFNYSLQEVILLQQMIHSQCDYGASVVLESFNSVAAAKRKQLYGLLQSIDHYFEYQVPGASFIRGKLLSMLDYLPGKSALAKKFLGISLCDQLLMHE